MFSSLDKIKAEDLQELKSVANPSEIVAHVANIICTVQSQD